MEILVYLTFSHGEEGPEEVADIAERIIDAVDHDGNTPGMIEDISGDSFEVSFDTGIEVDAHDRSAQAGAGSDAVKAILKQVPKGTNLTKAAAYGTGEAPVYVWR